MSKILNLKRWLTIPEAARHLAIAFGEDVSEADILYLALDRKLKLSVDFVNGIKARPGKVMPIAEAPTFLGPFSAELIVDGIPLGNETVFVYEERIVSLTGIWDIPMLGGERLDIEYKYQQMIGGPEVEAISIDGAFVCRNDLMYQIQEDFDCNEYQSGSIAQQHAIERRITENELDTAAIKELTERYVRDRAEFLARRKTQCETDKYFPAGGLPSDAMLVIQTSALQEFEREQLTTSAPDVIDSLLPVPGIGEKGFISIATAAGLLADSWTGTNQHDAGTLEARESTSSFAKALVATMNDLIHECAKGRMQAYSPINGFPIRPEDERITLDHTCLIRFVQLDDWMESHGMAFHYPLCSDPNAAVDVASKLDLPTPKYPKTRWAKKLWENMRRIDEHYGGHAEVMDAIRWLKEFGGPTITSGGASDEIQWRDDDETYKKPLVKQTVLNNMILARRYWSAHR